MSVDYIQSSVKDFFVRIDDMEIKLPFFYYKNRINTVVEGFIRDCFCF